MLLLNSVSLNMVADLTEGSLRFEEISPEEARRLLGPDFTSAVGHADTAAVYAAELGVPVETNRITVALNKGDVVVVGQYRGPRLAEGATTLPDGAKIVWLRVELQ